MGGGAEALAETQPGSPKPNMDMDMETQVDQKSDGGNAQQEKSPEVEPVPGKNSNQLAGDTENSNVNINPGVTKSPEHQPNVAKRKPSPQWDHTVDTGDDSVFASTSAPPAELSERAIYMRLHRVFKKRKDGTFILDDEWNKAWLDTDGGGRESLYAIFEKVGYDRDRFPENNIV